MLDLKNMIRKGSSARPPRIMLTGVEGVGKSTFGAQCPNPLFLCSEDGLVGTQFDSVASIAVSTWSQLLQTLDAIAANPMGYKTLVIDTMDWLEPLCEDHVVAAANRSDVKTIEDFGYGKGGVLVAEEFRRMLAKLDAVNRAGLIVVGLAHSWIKPFANPVGENYDRYESKMSKKVAALCREWSDANLFARFEVVVRKDRGELKAKAKGGDRRIVHTTHSAGWDAKNRHNLPEVMDLDAVTILQAMGAATHDVGALLAELRDLIAKLPEDVRPKAEAALVGREGDGRHMQAMIAQAKQVLSQRATTNEGA